jgi:PAS domain S-box-containing protein
MSLQYFHIVSVMMVLLGLCFMIVSVKISLTINKVVKDSLRRKWSVITSLMVLFLIGYSGFLILQFQNSERYLEVITGIVFLGGALFVLLVMGLIQNTLLGMNRASRFLEKKIHEHELISEKLSESRATLESIFNSAIPLCITNTDFEIIQANGAYYEMFDRPDNPDSRQKCFESRPSEDCHSENCPMTRIIQGEKEVVSDMSKHVAGREKTFIVTARPFLNAENKTIGIVESFQDITSRKLAEEAKEELIAGMQHALDEVNFLSGLLPICSACKKIRDDKGYWNKIESYITSHSKVEFSHSICPDCAQKLYPDLYKEVTEEKD